MLLRDLSHSLRQLRNAKGFTVAALLCLGLGVGITTAIFSVVQSVLLRPLPYKDPGRLVRLYTEFPNFANGGLRKFWTSAPEFLEMRRDLKRWETIDAWQSGGVNLTGSTEPVRVSATFVTSTLLQTLGIAPVKGRLITPADDEFGAPPVVVLGEGLWRRSFGADPNILSRDVWVNGRKTSVVGVMPQGFEFPAGETEPTEVWLPVQLNPASPGGRGGHRFYLLGRLRQGVTLAQAQQEMREYTVETGKKASDGQGGHMLHPTNHPLVSFGLQDEVTGSVKPALWALLGATGFVLLIACGNVANLLLARAEARSREIAIRRALGAGTGELIRQFLVEGLMLSLGGAALGVLFARITLRVLLTAAAGSLPRAGEVNIDLTVLLFSCGLAIFTGVFFGFAPLVQLIPRAASDSLKGTRTTATREAHWLRGLMITGEMALALILLIGSGLMIGAFWRLQHVDTGLRPENVLTLQLALPGEVYREPAQTNAFWRQLDTRLNSLPGVIAASFSSGLPPQRPINANDTEIEGFKPEPNGPGHNIDYWNFTSPRYLAAMGVDVIEGRWFSDSDGPQSPPVVVINESMARIYYGGKSPIGRRVRPAFQDPWRTIVGVVRDVRNAGLDRPAGTELYLPIQQVTTFPLRGLSIQVRTRGPALAQAGPVQSEIRSIDASLPVARVRTMEDVIYRAQARPRFLTMLLGLFSSVALGLAALGMYSVMSYSVAQRTAEFGIRMAMGAQRPDVLRLVLVRGLMLASAGFVIGAGGAFALNRFLKGALYGVGEFNPLPFLAMAALLVFVTLLACVAPAWRATRVDPLVALRYE
jgi:putative ABC transport system permease protein